MLKSSIAVKKFKESKIVFLTTFSASGEERSRPMLNQNEDPYEPMWFPTHTDSQKVKDSSANPRVLVTFPAENPGEYYEVEGRGEMADREFVEENWLWWYLYWHPGQRERFWLPGGDDHPERSIIWVHPGEVRRVKRDKITRTEP